MKAREPEDADVVPLTTAQFRASPEFRKFKGIMRKLLAVPKPELDRLVERAKKDSPRAGNSKAAGRKPSKQPLK
jgi:hypothetical protein